MTGRTLRIFVSSPGDVVEERRLAGRVIGQLEGRFANSVRLEPIFWEHEPVRATASFQEQIIRPSETDIVVCILWSRLGTRLPAKFERRPDGTRYESGTAFEFEEAKRAYDERGAPDLLVYQKTADPKVSLQDPDLGRAQQQWEALRRYLKRWFVNEDGSFAAGITRFATAAEFEQLLHDHLRGLIRKKLEAWGVAAAEDVGVATWHSGSPFRGLAAFDVEHAPVFFGRTRAVGDIKSALADQAAAGRAFLLVFGMSGCGKSSLVRAGVLPTITTLGVIEGVHLWRWCVLRPSDAAGDPLDGLAAALFGESALPELESLKWDRAALAKHLKTAPQLAGQPITQALKSAVEQEALAPDAEARLVVVIDQVEELFTLERVDEPERARLVEALSTLAGSGVVWVIGTMRSDFYHRCAELPELVRLTEGPGQYHLLPPSAPEIAQMIRAPARAAGLRFEERPATGERLDDVLHEAAARSPAALPLLEFTLDELFKERTPNGVLTFDAYKHLGGLEGALARRAEEVFSRLTPKVQAALPAVLRMLVTVDTNEDGRATARPAAMAPLTAHPDREALVNALLEARLVAADRADDGTVVVRVAHEALLQAWPRLQKWLLGEQKNLLLRAEIEYHYKRWQDDNENPDLLFHLGKRLSQVMAEPLELEPGPQAYLDRCRAKQRRRIYGRSGIALAVFLIVGSLLGIATSTYLDARAQESSTLVAASIRAVESGEPVAGIDKALQAMDALPRFQRMPNGGAEAAKALGALVNAVSHTHDPEDLGMERAAGEIAYMASFGPLQENGEQSLVTASSDGGWIWDVRRGVPPRPLKGHEGAVFWAEFSPDGRRIVTASDDGTARVWDANSGQELLTLSAHEDTVNTASFAAAGDRIVTASVDRTARIWDAASGEQLLELSGHAKVVWQASFSPDGRRVVTASGDREAWIWDAHSGRQLRALVGHTGWVQAAAFSPDGQRVVTAGADGQMRIWDADSGELIRAFADHGGPVRSAAFGAQGRLVVTASDDGTARVWNVGNLDDAWAGHTMRFWQDRDPELAVLPHRDDRRPVKVLAAAFSPDGQRIVTVPERGDIRLWWCRSFESYDNLLAFARERSAEARNDGAQARHRTTAPRVAAKPRTE